jgi:hypothetical protein
MQALVTSNEDEMAYFEESAPEPDEDSDYIVIETSLS